MSLVLLPRLLEPLRLDDVIWYDDEGDPSDEVCADTGFYVPRYLGVRENASLSRRMPRLEVMQLLTVGYDYALAHVPPGVELCNAQGVHEGSTAELALGLTIASLRRIDVAARDMAQHRWHHERGRSLQFKNVLVVGAGPVGRTVAHRFGGMGCSVVLVARTAREDVHGAAELPGLIEQADVVVVAVSLNDTSVRLIDAGFLSRMKQGALLVNVSRGAVVDTDALEAALRAGRICAALDVTDPEPLPADHTLWSAPNLLVTAHIGGNTDAFPVLAGDLIVRQVTAWRAGQQLMNVIRP